ncbi:hypothetical protein P7C71_g2917, partial [Lecanoromycetidae sp. Uapishka_2]
MFSALNQVEGLQLPLFETRKALIIVNLQNDSLYFKDDLYITKNREFVPRLKEMIPYFREHGDVVWVCTHMAVLPSAPSPDAAKVEADASNLAERNRSAQNLKEQQIQDDTLSKKEHARDNPLDQDLSSFYPSSRTKKIMTRPSAEARAEKRSADLQVFNDTANVLGELLSKPRKGQQARFYIGGTKGAEICDELLDVVDYERDLIVTKHHYSAFDQTSLLMALRTKLVTEVYLCGCLTNVGIYSTAADAVQHGLQVTVVEDCLGYRSEDKHEEAMRQMADIMGVNGIDSEEIIEESGGRPVPDSTAPGITLEELNLNADDTREGSGDSRIVYEALSQVLIKDSFRLLKNEVGWQTMLHRSGQVPRLVAVQGELGQDGEVPLYRHPADESPPLLPFTETTELIRREAESRLGQSFNHALIQLYRDGVDNISEHADKTLDLVRDSSIINVSIGAQRTMTLRTKKSKNAHGTDSPSMRQSQRIKMPHNSIFVLGPRTNREWLHGVRADKRPGQEKTEEEKAFSGERISITFRQIGTFMNEKKKIIWGSGARQKSKSKAGKIMTKDGTQMEAMINAFGKENHDTEFDWDAEYGQGFDVVNLINEKAKLILCRDSVANIRVELALRDKMIPFSKTEGYDSRLPAHKSSNTIWMHGLSNSENPILQEIDGEEIEGDLAIMFYLEEDYHSNKSSEGESLPDRQTYISQTAQSNELLFMFRQISDPHQQERDMIPTHRHNLERSTSSDKSLMQELYANLQIWEARAGKAPFIAGDAWTIIDCAFWPVLDHIVKEMEMQMFEEDYANLLAYHRRAAKRESIKAMFGSVNK